MNVPDTQLAVTLYNLRNYCKTADDLARTLDRCAEIGYRAIQVSGVNLPAEEIHRQLAERGLYCCATHENLAFVTGPIDPIIERMNILECSFFALGYIPAEVQKGAPFFHLCQQLDERAAALAEAGIKMGYHNHHFEFRKAPETGKTYLESMYESTTHLCAELDVHWITRGGGSPAAWIRRYGDRMPVIHFKDFAVKDDRSPCFAEIGQGNLDWPEILAACQEKKVRWYSVEQDDPSPDRDIFASIKISYNFLKSIGVK